jgi:serine/threonine protein kinase
MAFNYDPNRPSAFWQANQARAEQTTPTHGVLLTSSVNAAPQTPAKHGRPATHSGCLRTTHPVTDDTHDQIRSIVTRHGIARPGPTLIGGIHRNNSSSSNKRRIEEVQNTFESIQLSSGRSPQQLMGTGTDASLSPLGSMHRDPAGSPNIAYPYSDVHYSTASVVRPSQEFSTVSNADTEMSIFTRRILTEFAEVAELGSGCFGTVLLCEERMSGGLYAVKISRESLWKDDLQRLRHERDILAAVRGFPHIIYLHSSWEEGKKVRMYLQCQYCAGGALSQAAAKRRLQKLPWLEHEMLTIMAQMAIALDSLHAVNIAHVDVKPDNILIDDSGNFVLSDFGNSLTLDPTSGRPHNFFQRSPSLVRADASVGQSTASQPEGDCRYVSVDMINEKRYYKAGDIFSLGISLFELMSGEELPTTGQRYQDLRYRTSFPHLVEAGFTPGLVHLVERMMNIEAAARPTARQILEFVSLRPSSNGLSLAAKSPEHVCNAVTNGSLTLEALQFHKTCFEVSHYLLDASVRTLKAVIPSTCSRLFRRENTLPPQGATPPEELMTPNASFKTPTMKK